MPQAGWVDLVWDGARVLALGASVSAAYSPATNAWTALPAGYDGRTGAGLAWTGSTLLVWGGTLDERTPAKPPPHGLVYDPARGRWGALPASVLGGRIAPVTAWTGTQLLVWGGDQTITGATWTP